jgi:hypothetical protein
MEPSPHLDDAMRECIVNCSDCHDICLEAAVYAVRGAMEPDHVTLLLDCAEICDVSRDFMLRESRFHTRACGVCAAVCDACAAVCREHDDPLLQRCAEQCGICAGSCRAMAGLDDTSNL